MPFLTQGKTNWKYILILLVLAVVVGGGILGWQWWAAEKEIEVPEEIKPPEEPIVEEPPFSLTTTKLATIPEEYGKVKSIIFSPNGKRVAYIVKQEEGEFVVIDSKKGEVYDYISNSLFSPNSEHLAFIAKKNKKTIVVFDEDESKPYDNATGIAFSPNGEHFGYIARDEGEFFAVIDDKEGKPYYGKGVGHLVFSPDGKQFAYRIISPPLIIANHEKINNEKGDVYSDITDPAFNPEGDIYYVAKRAEEWFLIKNGKEIKGLDTYDFISQFSLSPNGKRFILNVGKENERFIVLDGEKRKSYHTIGSVVFSPDSQHIAYNAIYSIFMEGEYYRVVVDEKEEKEYGNPWGNISYFKPIFSPDSKHIAYGINSPPGKFFVVVDSKEGERYDWVGYLTFSADSKHIAYGARVGDELWWIVDEVEGFGK